MDWPGEHARPDGGSLVVVRAAEPGLGAGYRRYDHQLLSVLVLAGAVVWTVSLFLLLDSHVLDLQVYRTGGQAGINNQPLYDPLFPAQLPGPPLPFTYPPLAAVLFAVLAVGPWWLALALVTASRLARLVFPGRVGAVQLSGQFAGQLHSRFSERLAAGLPEDRVRVALLTAAVVTVAPALEPVRSSISFGQINLLLLGAIAADCLLPRTPWPRGLLIGLAAAIKLTPAAFVLFFIACRQWRPVLVAAGTFAGAALAGLLLAPADTFDYWFGALLDPARIGNLEFASNQSLRGVLHRLGLPAGFESLGWLALSAAIGALTLFAVSRLRERGDALGGLLVTASASLLVSPVSWVHHWVWVAPGLLWLGMAAWRRRSAALAALTALVTTVFIAEPHHWVPNHDRRELEWAWWQHLVGDAYFWCALAAVLVAAVAVQSVPSVRGQQGRRRDHRGGRKAGPSHQPGQGDLSGTR